MTPERWQRLESLFERALELPASERQAFLAGECGADEALQGDVEALLRADLKAGRYFARPILSGAERGESGETETEHGPRSAKLPAGTPGFASGILGERYRIVRLLGRGGMGEVYCADDLKLGQQVALKFLPPPVKGKSASLARFLEEVKIARRISHPAVCRVYDVGEVGGHHFLSMELIDGENLASLLRRIGRLPREKALEIAHQLAGGLAAVHREGVLHLDLKPDNLMIDGRGRARITDFGIATLAGIMGGAEGRWGTPAYMAPEQLGGGEVSAKTDVFALGLVLYELFTGRRPHAGVRPSGESPAELDRRRREAPLVPPSRWVEGLDPAVERAVLHCLEPDPGGRPTAEAVVASFGDRAAASRWRPAPGRTIPHRPHWAVESKLGQGGFGEVWLARHAKTRERRVFKFSYDAAKRRALEREITVFRLLKEELGDRDDIVRIIDWSFDEPPYFIESEYTAGGSLAAWAEAQGGLAEVSLAARLEIVAQVATALSAAHSVGVLHKDVKPANVLIAADRGRGSTAGAARARLTDFGLGTVTEQRRLAAAGITVRGLTETAEDSAAGTRLYMAPERLEGKAATVQGDVYALGVLLYQMVVGDLSRALAPGWRREVDDDLLCEDIAAAVDGRPERRLADAGRLAERLRSLAERRRARQEAEEAQRMAREAARAKREAVAARQVSDFLVKLFEVSDPYRDPGDEITAREILDRGAGEIESRLGDQPEIQARLMHTIGVVYRNLGSYDAARKLLAGALAIRRQLHGDRHLEVAESLDELAFQLRLLGRYGEAEARAREALAIRRRLLGDHPDVAKVVANLGQILMLASDYEEAEARAREALAMRRRLCGEHADVAESLIMLATLLWCQDRCGEAEPLYREALAMNRRLLGDEHPDVASSLTNLANLRLTVGDHEEAEELFREALARNRPLLGDEHPQVALGLNNLGMVRRSRGDPAVAERLFRQAIAILRRLPGAEHPDLGLVLNNLAKTLHSIGRSDEAEPLYAEALAMKRRLLGEDHVSVAVSLADLAGFRADRGDPAAGERWARRAIEIFRRRLPAGHWRTAAAESVLGACLSGLGRHREAEPLLLDAYPVLKQKRGERTLATRDALQRIVRLYEAWGKDELAESYARRAPPPSADG